jgi:hypothetical protein
MAVWRKIGIKAHESRSASAVAKPVAIGISMQAYRSRSASAMSEPMAIEINM